MQVTRKGNGPCTKPALTVGHVVGLMVAGMVMFWSRPAPADESPFGYVYTTDLLPRGKWELEQWATANLDKSQGSYKRFDFREEVEYGVTDNFQLALYGNWYNVNAKRDGVDGATSGPRVPENVDPTRGYSSTQFESASLEMIWRVLSPYKDPIGLAFYIEPSIGPKVVELEGKVIVQKNFLEDQLIWAANLTIEPEWEQSTGDPALPPSDPGSRKQWEKATALEFTTGLSYRFAAGWFAGLEFRNHNEFAGVGLGHPEHSAFFLGPNIHYSAERFWVTLAVLPQLPVGQAYNDDQRAVLVGGRLFGDEHEKLEIRLRAGWVF